MFATKKNSEIDVFVGRQWEAASVKSLLNDAYIQVNKKDNKQVILLSVPSKYYTAAIRIIGDRSFL